MPVYEYKCKRCQHRFEELVFGEEKIACQKCQRFELERQFSVFGTSTGACDDAPPPGACGSCGDPRGPGSCR